MGECECVCVCLHARLCDIEKLWIEKSHIREIFSCVLLSRVGNKTSNMDL